jgi:hypothetical protein
MRCCSNRLNCPHVVLCWPRFRLPVRLPVCLRSPARFPSLQMFDAIDANCVHASLFGSNIMPAFTQYLVARGTVSRLVASTIKVRRLSWLGLWGLHDVYHGGCRRVI